MTDSLTEPTALRAAVPARAALEPEILDGGVEGLILDRAFGDRVRRLVVREGATILDLLEAAEMPPRRARRCVARVNGDDVPMDQWETRRLRVGDIVAIAVRPGKGGKSNPLRTILQLVVFAVAVVVGIFAGPSVGALVNAVGSFLINALVPPPKPKQDPKETPTYAIEGATNELRLFGQVPVVMGARRLVLPHAARPFTEIVGNDVHFRMLLTGGVGPASFSDIRVGETPIENLDEFAMEIRTGVAGEPGVTLYTNQPRESAVGAMLTAAGGWEERETDFDTDEISVDVSFDRGLVTYNDEGNRKSRTVNLEIRWAPVGTETWTTVTPTVDQAETTTRSIFGPLFTRLMVEGMAAFDAWRTALLGGPPAPSGSWTIKAADAKPVRRNRRWAVPRGKYRVQLRRVTADSTSDKVSDECQWSTLRSIKNEAPSVPPGTPLIALNIRATDRVNGQIEPITAVVTSIRPMWDGTAFGAAGPTRNPGDLLYAALTGPGNSRPQPLSRIATQALGQFAELCDARGWTADFVFEDGRSVGEVFRALAACGRGAVTRIDGRYGVFPDVPRLTTGQLYTPRNSRGFRAKRRFLPEVHALRIPFPNEEKQHRTDERIVYADGYDESNATIYEVLTFDGITNPEKVHEHGRYYLAQLKLRPESYFLTTDIEHAVSAVGDVAYIQHDAILVGLLSARVVMRLTNEGGDCVGVRLDEEAVMEAGKLYGLRVRRTDTTFALAVLTEEGATFDLTFEEPMGMADAPRAGDLVSFGERGLETIEAILRRKGRPTQDKTCEIEFEPYGHPGIDDATTGDIPPWDSRITDPYRPRPPQPEILNVVWGEDGIRIEFAIPPSRQSAVAGFAVRWRETPDDGADGEWEGLPQLAAGARLLVTPPPPINTSTDVEIVAFDGTGNRGPAALQIEIESEESVAAPTILSVTGISKTGPGGGSMPALAVEWTPALETRLNRLTVQVGPEGAEEEDWVSAGSLDPKAGKGEVAANLPPGGIVDARFRLESRRGAFSDPWIEVRGVVMPTLVSDDSAGLGGRPADEVLDELGDTIAASAANAAAIIAEAVRATAAEGVVQGQVTTLAAEVTTARGGKASLDARITDEATAAASATAAVATRTSTLETQAKFPKFLPERPTISANFTNALPTPANPATAPAANVGAAVAVANEGDVRQIAGVTAVFWTVPALAVFTGKTFRFNSRDRVTVDGVGNLARTGYSVFDKDWTALAHVTVNDVARNVASGWVNTSFEVTAATILASYGTAAYIRPYFRGGHNGGLTASGATWQLAFLRLEDITDLRVLSASVTAAEAAAVAGDVAVANTVTTLRAQFQRSDMPARFDDDGQYFTSGYTDNPLTVASANPTQGTFQTVAGKGRVWRTSATALHECVAHKGVLQVISGHDYSLTFEFRAVSDATNGQALKRLMGFQVFNAAGTSLGGHWAAINTAYLAASGWLTESFTITAASILAAYPTAAWIRPLFFKWSNVAASDGQVELVRLDAFDATVGTKAELAINAGAIATLEGKTEAWWELALSTGIGVDAFMRARVEDGSAAVGLGADVIGLYNRLGGEWKTAVKIAGGDVTVLGNILAGGKVYIGSTGDKWELALQGKQFSVADGDTITYGVDLGVPPDFAFSEIGLAPKTASETYDLYADGATSTSAIVRLKIRTPGTPTTYSKGPTSIDTGSTPKFALSKGADPDANSNLYTFVASFSLQATMNSLHQSDPKRIVMQLGIYSKKSGVWTREGALTFVLVVSSSGTGLKTYTATGSGSMVLQSGPSDFGVHLEGAQLELQYSVSGDPPEWYPYASTNGAVTQLGSVQWVHTPSSGTRSATPSGEVGKVTVVPKNIS